MSGNEEESAVAALVEALQGPWVWTDPATGESVPYTPEMTAQRLLDALKANGYAVVELSKPNYREPHGYGYGNENPRLSHWGVFACTEDGCVHDQNCDVSPEDAWTIGSWWLAASRCITERDVAAERDSEER
ncbi:hypothetical protein [Mycobacteroides saopaulense]|uniref:hypothetical protein n=1 Tax=Mycobacteroides saopaulense TaxID=1578165 RepID=UPI001F1FE32A|nr:hypothetical protein [Mycobacteroides saopaulense]